MVNKLRISGKSGGRGGRSEGHGGKKGIKLKITGSTGLLIGCAVLGFVGILICGYGYAALSQDLLISGEGTVSALAEIRNVEVRLESATGGGMEGYNSNVTVDTASIYPQIPQTNGQANYVIKTCNTTQKKSFELVGVSYPVSTLVGMSYTLDKVDVGTKLVVGTVVGPGECIESEVNFTQGAGSSAVAALQVKYQWQEYAPVKFTSKYMQDLTTTECANVSTRETTQMTDKRDGKIYWVTKMHDGNCWMTQNLDYDGGGKQYTAANIADWVSQPLSNEEQYYQNNDNNKGHDSEGNYYSQAAATNPSDPVCPVNWHLSSASEWNGLLAEMGSGAKSIEYVTKAPFYLRVSGWVHHLGLKEKGSEVGYRTSTGARDSTQILEIIPSGVSMVQDTFDWGANARCVAGAVTQPTTIRSINTMQEMTAQICENTLFGEMKQLTDTRDGKKYWVSRLRGGKCWMVQNLDYDGGGTRYTAATIANWSSDASAAQYMYNGDNAKGHESLGSYYSAAAAANVCPANWRIPSGTDTGEYAQLGPTTMTFYNAVRSPFYFRVNGWTGIDNHVMGLYDVGKYGGLWSSSVSSQDYKFSFEILDGYFSGQQSVTLSRPSHVSLGYGVRCLYAGS